MLSEALLFAITAIDPIGYDYHWEKVFPALVNGEKGDTPVTTPHTRETPTDVSLSSKLDQMMSRAGIDVPMMERLAEGMNRLSQEARSISSLSTVKDANAAYCSQMSSATENLEQLNRIYSSHIEQMSHQEEHIRTISSTMQRVAESSTRVSGSIERLAQNLETLGSIYGNVLTAMNQPHK
jgi:DNA repair ATPase RecN